MAPPTLAKYPNLVIRKSRSHGCREFLCTCQIPFDDIESLTVSVANRHLVRGNSGLVRHLPNAKGEIVHPDGVRIVDGRVLTQGRDKRLLHWSYEQHFQQLGIRDDAGRLLVPAIANSWRDLGQNPWHVLWESPTLSKLWTLEGAPFSGKEYLAPRPDLVCVREDEVFGLTAGRDLSTGRVYTCLAVPNAGPPDMRDLRFDKERRVYDADMKTELTGSLRLAASGKALLIDGEFVAHDRIEQYYDVAHVFPVSKSDPEHIGGVSDRPRKSELLARLYRGYPAEFSKRCREALAEGLGTARYYFNVVGIAGESLVFLHVFSDLRSAAEEALHLGVRSAIIADEGGSVSLFSSFNGPNGGFENVSSYFRPSAIAILGIRLVPR